MLSPTSNLQLQEHDVQNSSVKKTYSRLRWGGGCDVVWGASAPKPKPSYVPANALVDINPVIEQANNLGAACVTGVVVDDKSFVPACLGVVAQQERWSTELAHRGACGQRQRVILVSAMNVRRKQRREPLDNRRFLQLAQLIGRHHRKPNVRQDFREALLVSPTRVTRCIQPTHDSLYRQFA